MAALTVEGVLVVAGGGVPTGGAEARLKVAGLPPAADAYDVELLVDGVVVEGGVEAVGERGAGDVAFLIPPGVGGGHTLQFAYRGGGAPPRTSQQLPFAYAPPVVTDVVARADGAGNVWYAVEGVNFGRAGAVVRVDGVPLPSPCVRHAADAPHSALLLVDLPAGVTLQSVTVAAGGVASAPFDCAAGPPVVARAAPTRFPPATTAAPGSSDLELVIDGLRLQGDDVQVALLDHGVEAEAVVVTAGGRRLTCRMPPRPLTAAPGEARAVVVPTPAGASAPLMVQYGDARGAPPVGAAPSVIAPPPPLVAPAPASGVSPLTAPPPPPPPLPASLPPAGAAIAIANAFIAPPVSSSGMRPRTQPAVSSPLAGGSGGGGGGSGGGGIEAVPPVPPALQLHRTWHPPLPGVHRRRLRWCGLPWRPRRSRRWLARCQRPSRRLPVAGAAGGVA